MTLAEKLKNFSKKPVCLVQTEILSCQPKVAFFGSAFSIKKCPFLNFAPPGKKTPALLTVD